MIRRALRWLGAMAPGRTLWDVPPNQPATSNKTLRVPDELWAAAMKKAHDEGKTLTEVIIEALKRFLRD